MTISLLVSYFLLLGSTAFAIRPYNIHGGFWACPYHRTTVQKVAGKITAWDRNSDGGFWIRGLSDGLDTTSDSIHVVCLNAACAGFVPTRGVSVLVDGVVDCDFSGGSKVDNYDFTTRIIEASRISITPPGEEVNASIEPIVLGVDRIPPTELLSSLDEREQRFFGDHSPAMYQSFSINPLDPTRYGLDFWRSLESELVRIRNPVSLGPSSQLKQGFWVRGDWKVTGKNAGGGLTMTLNSDNYVDTNPEAIFIGQSLNGAQHPEDVMMGTEFEDIIGVVTYRDDSFRVLPLSAPKITYRPNLSHDLKPTSIVNGPISQSNCERISVVTYNVLNLGMQPRRLAALASQVVKYLNAPSVLFLQEIQNDNDDEVRESRLVLTGLAKQIRSLGGPAYMYAVVEPNGITDGTGAIRNVILYRADQLELVARRPGRATDATWVTKVDGRARLTFNPGLIEPNWVGFIKARKPLAVLLRTKATGQDIWAINVHTSSKGESSVHSNIRPPLNKGHSWRVRQAKIFANFVRDILDADPDANVVLAGDFNEVAISPAVFNRFDGVLEHATEVTGVPPQERYSYVHQGYGQMLDHILVSPALADMELTSDIVHLNTWAMRMGRMSDHDPFLVGWKMCAPAATNVEEPKRQGTGKMTRSRMPRRST